MKYSDNREEAVKNKVAQDFFDKFDCTEIIKDIDFAVKSPTPTLPFGEGVSSPPSGELEGAYLLWAEAKKKNSNIYESIAQLVLTIGKARTFNEILPPPFLGCFDPEKIAFVPYSDVQDIFYQNDFNWKVAPSDYNTKEFKLILQKVKESIDNKSFLFYFEKDEDELRQFIRENFIVGKTETSKIRIDKNNFITIYTKWLAAVKPTIQVDDWDLIKKNGIIDGYFYLADLLSDEGKTLTDKLYVLLENDHYVLKKGFDVSGFKSLLVTGFSDNQKAYNQFWAKYKRPPEEEYWEYIIKRQDLLVPQDIRERKGSFYTPDIWVELSQKYLADTFGKDWQDEYYIWDCAAGTGNLLIGLVNKYNIWASTIDKADVDVMKQRIENGANLLESHVFQFDFLNDDFSKLPQGLQDIINNPETRKKLIIYINPPYVESTSYGIKSKAGVSSANKTYEKYKNTVGIGINEIFVQFFVRIYDLMPDSNLASFSKVKYINSQNFSKFRGYFKAKFKKGFICRSNTFDNVTGKFPIGFLIWDLKNKKQISEIQLDIYESNKEVTQSFFKGTKKFFPVEKGILIIDWLRKYFDKKSETIAYLRIQGTDFQTNNTIVVTSKPTANDIRESKITEVTINNLIETSIYFAVRKVISATWINDRDQFLYPNDGWEIDTEFQNDCLAYTLFNNNIQSKHGVNHWIPFMEEEINAKDTFASHFMVRFIMGKKIQNTYVSLFDNKKHIKRKFSKEAQDVFNAGRKLWKYYHNAFDNSNRVQNPVRVGYNVNASLYDIKEYFKGRNEKGKMNPKSTNPEFNNLEKELTAKLKILAKKIEIKVYEYKFLNK